MALFDETESAHLHLRPVAQGDGICRKHGTDQGVAHEEAAWGDGVERSNPAARVVDDERPLPECGKRGDAQEMPLICPVGSDDLRPLAVGKGLESPQDERNCLGAAAGLSGPSALPYPSPGSR